MVYATVGGECLALTSETAGIVNINGMIISPKKKRKNADVEFDDSIDIFSFDGVPFGIIGGGVLEDEEEVDDDEYDPDEDDDDLTGSMSKVVDEVYKVKKKKDKYKKSGKAIKMDKVSESRNKEIKEMRKQIEAEAKARKKAEAARIEKERERRQAETDLIQLIARHDYILANLPKLDNSKRKDAVKIVQLNIELRDVEASIAALQREYNLYMTDINQGSSVSRGWNCVKRKVKNGWNKIRKFFKRNKEVIVGVASVVLPIVASTVAGLIIKG